jgi:catechol 2,3-dioxygenase-like lactoylglutathione lyase family enzyme
MQEVGMLGDRAAMATVAVKKLDVAKKFYEGKLGLELTPEQQQGALTYKTGNAVMLVYESRYAGTNQATAVTWVVGDQVERVVQALKQKGVAFEHYDDLPNTTRQGDVHVAGDMKAAWCKDPDGNILAIVGG